MPRPGGVHYPPRGIDERAADRHPLTFTVRAFLVGAGWWRVMDIVLEPGTIESWQPVERRVLFFLQSPP